MNTHKLTAGQKVWLEKSAYRESEISEPIEVTITKVGRKYFEIDHVDCRFAKFDKRERDRLLKEIRMYFTYHSSCYKLDLDDIRKIHSIIENKTN